MTTLIGLKAENGREGVILASDLSRTATDWIAQGDVAYRAQTKSEGQKIYVSKNRELAVCMSGVFDSLYTDFLSRLLDGQIDFRKAINEKGFPELSGLNHARWGNKFPDNNHLNGLLIATRFENQPRLYTCWPLGLVEPVSDLSSFGSGSQYALKHIQSKGKLIPYQLSISEGVSLASEALEEASRDIYTGGLDLVVITSDEIQEFGAVIRESMETAKKAAVDSIRSKFA